MFSLFLDKRKYLRLNQGPPEPFVVSTCHWRQNYNIQVSMLQCEIHHCGHPNTDEGSHPMPEDKLNISLVETSKTQVQ